TRSKRDWSSDVCSSDLIEALGGCAGSRFVDLRTFFYGASRTQTGNLLGTITTRVIYWRLCRLFRRSDTLSVLGRSCAGSPCELQIGRASCRERVQSAAC